MTTPKQTTVPLADVMAKITLLPWEYGNGAIWADCNGEGNHPTEVASYLSELDGPYLAHAARQLPRLVAALEWAQAELGKHSRPSLVDKALAAAKAVPVPAP